MEWSLAPVVQSSSVSMDGKGHQGLKASPAWIESSADSSGLSVAHERSVSTVVRTAQSPVRLHSHLKNHVCI